MTEEKTTKHDIEEEPMLYEEPPRMGWRDTVGVVIALIALVIIGIEGYIWLTPGMTLSKFLGQDGPSANATTAVSEHTSGTPRMDEPAGMEEMSTNHMPGTGAQAEAMPSGEAVPSAETEMMAEPSAQPDPTATPAANPLADLSQHDDTECPACGMDASRSLASVAALWSDGTHTHHDCFDCMFTWGKEQGLTLIRAEVLEHGTTTQDANWLDAASATYLYGTSRIEMSMPPYVAAFESRAGAEAAQPEFGGEVMDFAQLTKQWK